MKLRIDGIVREPYPEAMFNGKDIVIAIDSSKTNTGMVVSNTTGSLLAAIEFDGSKDGDVLELCREQRKAMSTIFSGANIKAFAIEDIITKKGNQGLNQHASRYKITAVYMSFIFWCQEYTNLHPLLVNNKTWKHAVLPEKYRSLSIGKGSLQWFIDLNHPYACLSDDVTDAACILIYTLKHCGFRLGEPIKEDLTTKHVNYKTGWLSTKYPPMGNCREYVYNEDLSFEKNCNYVINRLNGIASFVVPVASVPFSYLYKHAITDRPADRKTDSVRVYFISSN